jgi:hypothetical protein
MPRRRALNDRLRRPRSLDGKLQVTAISLKQPSASEGPLCSGCGLSTVAGELPLTAAKQSSSPATGAGPNDRNARHCCRKTRTEVAQ